MKVTAQDIIQNAIDADHGLVEPAGFVRYDPATGTIVMAGTQARTHTQEQIAAGEPVVMTGVISQSDMLTFADLNYVDLSDKTIKPKQPFQGTLSGVTLLGLPVPCRIGVQTPFVGGSGWWAPTWFIGDAADIELGFEVPDTYRVTIESVRYMTAVFLVTYNG